MIIESVKFKLRVRHFTVTVDVARAERGIAGRHSETSEGTGIARLSLADQWVLAANAVRLARFLGGTSAGPLRLWLPELCRRTGSSCYPNSPSRKSVSLSSKRV